MDVTLELSQQQLLVGPVAIGSLQLHDLGLGHAGRIRYEAGWLFGATCDRVEPGAVVRVH